MKGKYIITGQDIAPETSFDIQVGGSHYKDMMIQPIEFILKNKLGFCEGNIIKYVCRYKNKNGVEDLKKARHYMDMLIEDVERKTRMKD